MATTSKIVKMPAGSGLSPELRDFIDACVVPALLKKYLAGENGDSEKAVSATISIAPHLRPAAYSDSKRHRGSE